MKMILSTATKFMKGQFLKKYSQAVLSYIPSSCLSAIEIVLGMLVSSGILITVLPILVPSICITFIVRQFLKAYFVLPFTKEKYTLMSPEDSIWAYERKASYSTLQSLNVCEGICDIEKIREKFLNRFVNWKRDGEICGKMKLRISKIFGYYCWKDCSRTFDINKIVRYINIGVNPESEFTEAETFRMLGRLFDERINPGKDQPQWEVLLVPNYIYRDPKKRGKRFYAFIIRVHHSYTDGIAISQRFQNTIGENVIKSSFDPFKEVNIGIGKKYCEYLKLFFLGPYFTLKIFSTPDKNFLHRDKLRGPKTVGWTKPIRLAVLKKIKFTKQTTITAVLNCALGGALRKLWLRNGEEIPEKILAVLALAKFPYKWMECENRFSSIMFPVNMSLDNVADRLDEAASIAKYLQTSTDFLMNYWVIRIIGLFPSSLIKFCHDQINVTAAMTNIPGPDSSLKVFGGDTLVDVGMWGPLKSTTGIGFTVFSFNDFIRANVVFDGCILSDPQDMTVITNYFEEEIKEMGRLVGISEDEFK